MLLLVLLSGFLASCASQTMPPIPPSAGMSTVATSPLTPFIQAASVLPTAESTDNVVAFLQTALQSSHELNETTLTPVLNKLHEIIQQLDPNAHFTLTVKNITEV